MALLELSNTQENSRNSVSHACKLNNVQRITDMHTNVTQQDVLASTYIQTLRPIFLQDAISLLRWDRTKSGSFVDKTSYEHAKTEQNNLRKVLQLTPDIDSPWEKVHYQD